MDKVAGPFFSKAVRSPYYTGSIHFRSLGASQASAWPVFLRENGHNRLCEGAKVVQFVVTDMEHNPPVNLLVVVRHNISDWRRVAGGKGA